MKLYRKFIDWNTRRRHMKHKRWLKKARVVNLPAPDRACQRNKVQSL